MCALCMGNAKRTIPHMYNKLLSLQAIATICDLAGVDRLAKLDLTKMGFSGKPGCSMLVNVKFTKAPYFH